MTDALLTMAKEGLRERRGRDSAATRESIIVAALEEFADKGFHGARVDEIAKRTATSKHMIYYYFSSKDGLYAAALERAYADFRAAESIVDYDKLEPAEALETLVGNSFDSHVNNPHLIRIIMSENLDMGRHVVQIDHGVQRDLVIGITKRILDRGAATGQFRRDIDPLQFHLSVSSLCFYFVANRFTFSSIFDHDMASSDNRVLRRAEVIRMMTLRVLA